MMSTSIAAQAMAVPAEPVNARLLDVATGKIPHLYAGLCPDIDASPRSRDPECPACQVISAAESAPKAAEMMERLAQQQAGTHPAPCARSCEANAYQIEVRRYQAEVEQFRAEIDDLLATCHRLALELECLLLDTKDLAPVSRWWDSAMAALDGWHKAKDAASARPVPAEPVNARLVEALLKVARMAEDLKRPCGMDPESPQAIRNQQYMSISYAARAAIAAAEAQQAEPVRLTDADLIAIWDCYARLVDEGHSSGFAAKKAIAATEAAVLRANGYKVEG